MKEHPLAKQDPMLRFEAICHDQGLPLTVQRRVVFESVLARDDHPTTDQIYEDVRGRIPGVSRTTVYRVLDMLVRVGVISKACHPGAAARFDRNTRQHHHLVCLHCDRVIDVEDERLDTLDLPSVSQFDFEITEFRVQLRGACGDCREKHSTSKSGLISSTRTQAENAPKPVGGKMRQKNPSPKREPSRSRRTRQ